VYPGLKYKILPVLDNNGEKVKLSALVIKNKNIARLLKDAEKTVLFVTTIGSALEKEINRLFSAGEPTKAVILDAVGSEAVEVLTDTVQEALTQQAGPYRPTPRFSPGYGDWPVNENKAILRLLAAQTIGVKMSAQCMLSPQKTVTGIWGLVRKADGR
jgi:cobalamin-dependent methionine synthase I